MTLEYERQELRALMFMPIRHLQDYSADKSVLSRVGKAVSAHARIKPWDVFMQASLDQTLSHP
jgi:hypothetical protein